MTSDSPAPLAKSRLDWLTRETTLWQRAGVIDSEQANAILARYTPVDSEASARRWTLGRLFALLGGTFVGVGLIWLVAANLDQLSPVLRFVVVAALWLAFLLGGEWLATRPHQQLFTGVARLMAALTFGAVVFQAAQSLQVPAYEPTLVGLWGAGALLHAYAVRALPPLLVGLAAGAVWWIWQPLWVEGSPLAAVLCLATAAVVATSAAALHDRFDAHRWFGFAWRTVGAGFILATLFLAALPFFDNDNFLWNNWLIAQCGAAIALGAGAVLLARGSVRFEPLIAVAVGLISVLLIVWEAGGDPDRVGAGDWAHAVLSVVAYVALAVGIAALGVLGDNPILTFLAMAALVVFTTVQAFAVFAPIIQGAWLFVALGLVFLATGYLFDRARRGLVEALDDKTEGEVR